MKNNNVGNWFKYTGQGLDHCSIILSIESCGMGKKKNKELQTTAVNITGQIALWACELGFLPYSTQ